MPKAPSAKEIREKYSDYKNEWREIREEAAIDMRYVSGDPWDPKDRRAREDAGRPCISLDEINQYLNQAINNIRQNKRAIQVNPKGFGASAEDAEARGNIIRGIEYKSNAQAAYTTAFENAIQRSYGFARLTVGYESERTFDQEIRIRRIQNPDNVLLDPSYKEADASDIQSAFVTQLLNKKDFKRQFPKAKAIDFSGEQELGLLKDWQRERDVQLAEYWERQQVKTNLYLIQTGEGPKAVYEEEMGDIQGETGAKPKIIKVREALRWKVKQHIFNGVETLEENDWLGSYIPILACFGKELFFDSGDGPKRRLISMVRLARDPQMLHAFIASNEAEEYGMAPKAPFVGYVGQFETDKEAWEMLNKVPSAFVQIDPVVDQSNNQVLPPPSRPQFAPNAASYEMSKESARRAIQAAMGINPLPTAAQRQNEKSGIALQRMQEQQSIGSFHFTDNYDQFLMNAGRQINELLGLVYDTARDIPSVNAKGEHETIRINDQEFAYQNPEEPHLFTTAGEYDVTISTGPSYQSQREEASQFVDLIVQNLKNLPVPPPVMAKIFALAITLKQLGPIGNEIKELLDPQEQNSPEQMQAALGQAQQQIQALNAYAQQAEAKIQELEQEKQAKVVDNQARMEIEKLKVEAQITIAEIQTKAQAALTRAKWEFDMAQQLQVQAHDRGMQADSQAHEAQEGELDRMHQENIQASQQMAAAEQQQNQIAADQQSQQAAE